MKMKKARVRRKVKRKLQTRGTRLILVTAPKAKYTTQTLTKAYDVITELVSTVAGLRNKFKFTN